MLVAGGAAMRYTRRMASDTSEKPNLEPSWLAVLGDEFQQPYMQQLKAFVAEVVPFIERGIVRPVIDRRYPIDEIAAAHTHLEANANVGKVLIDL